MREVEIKAILKNKEAVTMKLKDLGCTLSEPIRQQDKIYIPNGKTIPVDSYVNVLRIREQNGRYILTLKQAVTNQLDCIERETEIEDPKAMEDIFKYLGFFEVAKVDKTRQKCKYQDMEICLDDVVGLGSFIEVEKIVEDDKADGLQEELLQFLETLGVNKEEQVFNGYDVLIAKQR